MILGEKISTKKNKTFFELQKKIESHYVYAVIRLEELKMFENFSKMLAFFVKKGSLLCSSYLHFNEIHSLRTANFMDFKAFI